MNLTYFLWVKHSTNKREVAELTTTKRGTQQRQGKTRKRTQSLSAKKKDERVSQKSFF